MGYKKVDKLIDRQADLALVELRDSLFCLRDLLKQKFEEWKQKNWMFRISNGLALHLNYTFTVVKTPNENYALLGVETTLTNKLNGKSKTFWIAGDKDPRAITEFMMTLTDEQCDSHVGIKFKGKK